MKDSDKVMISGVQAIELGEAFNEEFAGFTAGSRLGIAIAMIDSVLDETPLIRAIQFQYVIKTLIANHTGKEVDFKDD